MLTFKPAAGSYIHYNIGEDNIHSGAYLITRYNQNIAYVMNMTTMNETNIIIQFSEREYNKRLTVIA